MKNYNNKVLKKIICASIALSMILMGSLVQIEDIYASDSSENPIFYNPSDTLNFPQYPNPGYVRLHKDAQWVEGEDDVAKVTMKMDGKGVPKTTDVVLVIDRSGSMADKHTVTRTYEKEVEVDKQIPYNEVQVSFSASNVRYQYFDGWWIFGTWKDATASNVSISMTAYLDQSGNFKGYKNGTLQVNGFISSDGGYNLNGSSRDFSSWTSFNDNDCLDALIQIFGSKTSTVTLNGSQIVVSFPSDRNTLKSTQSYYIVKEEEIQTVTETSKVAKIESAKDAAKEFVDALLSDDIKKSLNRIGVVSYSSNGYGNGTAYADSQLSNSSTSLNTAIGRINANGGTHIQAGIKMAHEMLAGSRADSRYIVVLSDGEPTYSYTATQAESVTAQDLALNYPGDIAYKLTSFGTGIKGSGNSYTYSGYSVKNINTNKNVSVNNNGIPTISQALEAKKSGIEIYSIGFDVASSDEAKYTMRHVASSPDKFYETSDDLSPVFANIAGRIAKAGTDPRVVSAIVPNDDEGYYFKILTDAEHPVTASPGTAAVEENGMKISWDLDDITESTATLTYYIKLNVLGGHSILPDTMLDTGGNSSVVYKNHNEKWVSQNFPSTKLSAGEGTINVSYFLSNSKGEPVNTDGQVIPFKNRVVIEGSSYIESAALGQKIITATYAKPISRYINQSTSALNENGNAAAAEIPVSREPIYLNFPYYPEASYSVIYNGNGNVSGTAPVDGNRYYVNDKVTVAGKGSLLRTGYTFLGWNTDKDAAQPQFTEGKTVTMPAKNLTLYAVWSKSQYNLTIKYQYEDGEVFDTYTGAYKVGEGYNVQSAAVDGWRTDKESVAGTMPEHDVTITVLYEKVKNELTGHSMYTNKGLNPIDAGKTIFNLVSGFDYTFGFSFKTNENSPEFSINLTEDTGKYTLSNFILYEGNTVVSSADSIENLNKAKIEFGKTYTITYRLKCNEVGAGLSIEVNNSNLVVKEGVPKIIKLISNPLPPLE